MDPKSPRHASFVEPEMSIEWDYGIPHMRPGQPEPDFEWDYDVCPVQNEVKPTEPESFRSFLNATREEHREQLHLAAKSLHDVKISKRESEARSIAAENQRSYKEERQKEMVTKTYLDFLLHKRNQITRERIHELRKQGFNISGGKEHFSFIEGDPRFKKPEKRRHSFPLGDDESLREPSFLRDITALEISSEDEGSPAELAKMLQKGPIEWSKSAEGAADKSKDSTLPGLNKSLGEMLDALKKHKEKAYDYLIEDVYFPGVIDDAVNGKINFNQLAFDMTFSDGNIPEDAMSSKKDPMSLIEAFDERVERQTGAIKKTTMQDTGPLSAVDAAAVLGPTVGVAFAPKPNFMAFLEEKGSLTRILNREELVLASTVGIDVSAIVHNRPMNELIKAINSLQKAEYMNDFDKSSQAAEEAFKRAPPELAESAAIFGARNFRTVELSKKKVDVPRDKSYKPIEVVSYLGITKPMPDVRI